MTSPPADRYRRPPSRTRRVLAGLVAALAYAGAVALTVVALRDLDGWGVLGAGALGLLVAMLVVVGRTALAAARAPTGPHASAGPRVPVGGRPGAGARAPGDAPPGTAPAPPGTGRVPSRGAPAARGRHPQGGARPRR